jgi:lysozyme
MAREINQAGIDLIKKFEGCRLDVYRDAVGLPTVGVGHLIKPDDNLALGDSITQEVADDLLRADLASACLEVEKQVRVEISDNQFASLVSLTFNIGGGNFRASTLLRLVNESDFDGAAGQFEKWNHAGGRVLEGLTRRREAESALFGIVA